MASIVASIVVVVAAVAVLVVVPFVPFANVANASSTPTDVFLVSSFLPPLLLEYKMHQLLVLHGVVAPDTIRLGNLSPSFSLFLDIRNTNLTPVLPNEVETFREPFYL